MTRRCTLQRLVSPGGASGVRLFCTVILAGAILAGCDDKRRHQASESVAFKVIEPAADTNESPEAIAKAALTAMRDLQRVRSQGLGVGDNRAKYEEAMGRLFGVADQDRIYKAMKPDPQTGGGSRLAPTDITKDAAVRTVAESWTSVAAHYIDGMDTSTMRVLKAGQDRMMVTVEAVNAKEQTALAKIRAGAGMGAADTPFKDLTAEQQQKIRTAALAEGFNVPIAAEIKLAMGHTAVGWRVQSVDVGPAK